MGEINKSVQPAINNPKLFIGNGGDVSYVSILTDVQKSLGTGQFHQTSGSAKGALASIVGSNNITTNSNGSFGANGVSLGSGLTASFNAHRGGGVNRQGSVLEINVQARVHNDATGTSSLQTVRRIKIEFPQ